MSGVVLLAEPVSALDIVRRLGDEVANSTLVWSDSSALRDVSDELMTAGWDALVVRPDDEGFSGAAMGHRHQMHGVADVVVLSVESPDAVAPMVALAQMVVRHLPHEVPVLLTGASADALHSAWAPIAEEMEVIQVAMAPESDLVSMCRGAGKSEQWEG